MIDRRLYCSVGGILACVACISVYTQHMICNTRKKVKKQKRIDHAQDRTGDVLRVKQMP